MGNRKRRADRTYKDLKQKQKAGIADSMFQKTCDYYREHGRMPEGEDCEKIAGQIYQRVKGIAEKASFDEICSLYLYRLPRYETRIAENGLPEKKEKKQDADKPKVKQKGRSKKVCPNCGRKMKQQFIGLQHCKCGMSWKKDIGYFERDYGADVAALGFGAAYIEALVCSIGAGVGFMLAMVMFSGVRKRVEACDPPAPFKGLPITLIAAAITSLSFMGFGGLVENLFNVTL